MRVRMKADVSGSRNGVAWPPRGALMDVPDDEGAQLCAAGIAVPAAEADADVEKAVVQDDAEPRSALTKETAGGLVPGGDAGDSAGDDAPEPTPAEDDASAPAAKKAAPAKRTAAKKTAASPAADSK
ncbi:hypothetical protein ABZX77_30515 [Streptomyces sp. NPDC004237]|uniref:hypothetical protein n=1 Tax=Streptomyces sp. NPDC004237 TaxID=3154455 RepID=UPI00339F76C0